MSSKVIIIVSSGLQMGGVERASSNMANYFVRQGHKVIFLALFPLDRFFLLDDNVIFLEPIPENKNKIQIFKTLKTLRKILQDNKPDVVLAYTKFYSALVCLANIGLKNKVIISERSSVFYKWPFHVDFFSRMGFFLNPPYGVIAQTNEAASYQRKRFNDRVLIRVIYNSVKEISLYPDVKREKVILAVGRLNDKGKGFDRLLTAISKVNLGEWRLGFVGGTKEEAGDLYEWAKLLGVSDRVDFLGKAKDIDAFYARASIFVIPSIREGFPNALCEAMSAGLSCISFDFSAGPSEIIINGFNGLLVKDGDVNALANAIEELINDEKKRAELGRNALLIREKLSDSTIGDQYLDFLLNE